MNLFKKITLFTTVMTFCLIVLGAYVRLADAGLGCPDWPGCFGTLTVPESQLAIEKQDHETGVIYVKKHSDGKILKVAD